MKPRLVIPPDATANVVLSRELTEMVCRQKQAIWIANQRAGEEVDSLEHYADALCVPLVNESAILGALHEMSYRQCRVSLFAFFSTQELVHDSPPRGHARRASTNSAMSQKRSSGLLAMARLHTRCIDWDTDGFNS